MKSGYCETSGVVEGHNFGARKSTVCDNIRRQRREAILQRIDRGATEAIGEEEAMKRTAFGSRRFKRDVWVEPPHM